MSKAGSQLPPGFEALEPFAAAWAVAGANNRTQKRVASTPAERVAFFEAAKGLLVPALDYLDTKPIKAFDAREQRLMNLMLTFAHVAMAVEVQGDDEPKHARYSPFMPITRAPADLPG
jgi:hypothetical protein